MTEKRYIYQKHSQKTWTFQGGASVVFNYFCHFMSLHLCPVKVFVLNSRLVNFWGKKLYFSRFACSVSIVEPLF